MALSDMLGNLGPQQLAMFVQMLRNAGGGSPMMTPRPGGLPVGTNPVIPALAALGGQGGISPQAALLQQLQQAPQRGGMLPQILQQLAQIQQGQQQQQFNQQQPNQLLTQMRPEMAQVLRMLSSAGQGAPPQYAPSSGVGTA